ncbi:3'-phosphoadenosine 5'-phosphate phosphatase [Planctomycetes bacterium Pla163]|uniref:3'(2'),5-bisphosphonucleoside 3'(2')-phosphohydrolase n=1 Tax=Rohdeia mirabilis TaxID=2528008 RepID=A0A518D3M0_9BACT|nr:3'-phosphoadenosine 5'-phosphate phosphatase [Planctomycetes bacterium Pla163]
MTASFEAELGFARRIAREAGERVLALRASGRWTDPTIVGDVGDQAADAYLQGSIRAAYPNDGLLSEETVDSPARTKKSRTWIVDPLDGTKEYRTGRVDWAVHVALVVDGKPALGVVALPSLGLVLWGVCAEGEPLRHGFDGVPEDGTSTLLLGDSRTPGAMRLVCSRSHTPDWMERFATTLGEHELVPVGSVGYKASRLLLGEADAYVHKTGVKEWDTCAPECVALALGWHVSRLNGDKQIYNQLDPRNDELLICRPADAERIMRALRDSGVV